MEPVGCKEETLSCHVNPNFVCITPFCSETWKQGIKHKTQVSIEENLVNV